MSNARGTFGNAQRAADNFKAIHEREKKEKMAKKMKPIEVKAHPHRSGLAVKFD